MYEVKIMNQDIALESNEFLLRRFVSAVGYDYKTDYSPKLWPTFSDDTVALWTEIENRLKAPTCLNFDLAGFEAEIKEKLHGQDLILKNGPNYATSYHVGIQSGLNLAWRIVEGHIARKAPEEGKT